MRRFILNIVYFTVSLVGIMFLMELLIPQNLITHRNWEAEVVKNVKLFPGPYYPRKNRFRNELGDLAYRLPKYAVVKKDIRWQTDELGFRNEKFIKSPDVVIVGRSNIVGSTMSQENILSSQVSKLTGASCYNFAPYTFSGFISQIEQGVIDKPKVFVLGMMERRIPELSRKVNESISTPKKIFFKIRKNNIYLSVMGCVDKVIRGNIRNYLTARVNNKTLNYQSPIENRMFFFQGDKSEIEVADSTIKAHADVIEVYRDNCEKRGIRFVFFPIPNKETVYFDLVPYDKQPVYLLELHKELKLRGVDAVNTLELFTKAKAGELIYHMDDTHWNEKGVEILAKELAKHINTKVASN